MGSSPSTPRLLLIPPNISPSVCVCVDYARRVQSLGSLEGLNSESKTSVADGLTFRTVVSSSVYPTNPTVLVQTGSTPIYPRHGPGGGEAIDHSAVDIHSKVTAVLKGQRLVQSPETEGPTVSWITPLLLPTSSSTRWRARFLLLGWRRRRDSGSIISTSLS